MYYKAIHMVEQESVFESVNIPNLLFILTSIQMYVHIHICMYGCIYKYINEHTRLLYNGNPVTGIIFNREVEIHTKNIRIWYQ